jgi:hypothetical protein
VGAQGIAAEIPEELRSNSEELERKARFLRAWHAKMRPKYPNYLWKNPYTCKIAVSGAEPPRIACLEAFWYIWYTEIQ